MAADVGDGPGAHRRGVISLLLGEVIDALAIAAIVVLNAALGFRAERAVAALNHLADRHTMVYMGAAVAYGRGA